MAFLLLGIQLAGAGALSPQTLTAQSAPAHMTAEEDHRRMLDLLHITSLRRGPDGDPKSPNAANLDESKATTYTKLPDPLVLKSGKPVTNARVWWDVRRPEIVEEFDVNIYGRVPEQRPRIDWRVASTAPEMDGSVPVISSGSQQVEGGWVDAKGMFLGAVGAGSVYKLLGKVDLGTAEVPPMEKAFTQGDIVFRQHSGGHTTGPNWPTFLNFASRYIQGVSPTAESSGKQPSRADDGGEVALTFDDLPAHGPLPAGLTRVEIADKIVQDLQAAHAPPTYGFVNAKRLEEDASTGEVLQHWRDAGFPLGNHGSSHMDLNANSLEAFEQDVLNDESTLRRFMGTEDWHWLRFPYLREGILPKSIGQSGPF